jgi:hypothetical protein
MCIYVVRGVAFGSLMDGGQEDILTDDGSHGILVGNRVQMFMLAAAFCGVCGLLIFALMIDTARTRSLVAGIAPCI